MKTYLYNRVSSGKQSRADRDGLTRQSVGPEVVEFLKRHKLQKVETLVHIGSSFRGKNFSNNTALGKFIEKVKTREIETPVCLCFENWDRFGRDVEWKNNKRFYDLIDAGVSIGVVTMDVVIDQKYLEKNPGVITLVANDIERARKESQRKSGFAKRNITAKVERAKQGERIYFGGQSPRWIVGIKHGEFLVDVEMVKDIRRIFKLYFEGKSCVGIAKILNEEKRQRFGLARKGETTMRTKTHWYNTTIKNILTNRSLIGWCKVNDFESDDYYPKIIDAGLFNRIQNRVEQNATNRGGTSKTGMVTNIFRGLTWCKCGGDVGVRYHKVGKTFYSYMGCRKAGVNLCQDKTWWPSRRFEEQIFFMVLEKSPDELLEKTEPKTSSILEQLNVELGKVNILIRRNNDFANDPDLKNMPEIRSNLVKWNTRRTQLNAQIQEEESKHAVAKASPKNLIRLKEIFDMDLEDEKAEADKILSQLNDDKVRQELKNIVPELISRIEIDLKGLSFEVLLNNGKSIKQSFV